MNKYDEPLDLNSENSLSLIIEQIQPNTSILEFGPAMGRMTKYLSHNLNCDVYIVEIDNEAYDYVMNFAKDGILGDIENYNWFEKFRNLKFDYIIFADVLEHLVQPNKVLAKASELLRHDGRIMVSVPNIAYNAVIIDLINNKFKYRNTGILDSTHLRFFTYESFETFFNDAGLIIEKEKVVHLNLEHSGFNNNYQSIPREQALFLKNREFADAYQYVITVIKESYYNENKDNITIQKAINTGFATMLASLYIDTGSGYNEKEKVQQKYRINKENTFLITFILENYNEINQLRIDLCDDICTLENINVISDDGDLEVIINGMLVDNKYHFVNETARVYVNNPNGNNINKIEISGIINTPEIKDIKVVYNKILNEIKNNNIRLETILLDKQSEILEACKMYEDKMCVINELNHNVRTKQEEINKLNQELKTKQEEINKQSQELKTKQDEINLLNQELIYKQNEVIENVTKIQHRDIEIENNAKAIDEYRLCTELMQNELNLKNNEIESLRMEIDNMVNSLSWRVTKPFRKFRK
ncbi:hypothetical protein acsn021_09500 [Anaerocolumna cellulosilytica]|uniref:Uncharacterized protein n=1 Tax=Anaerocolumna cellulosilytica TaxID=433286 RepID=A0A6S6R2H3_9FIRM|nr:methyltransferase domain-containing protein [Anaerocolumna cellulosilytica]MBB5194436.1 2-polyprenyl-3-methyl-5-hydroxy-6-metoxy-1,4-benzoquinol methylase/predicted nucleic acid-binding Zn-ribbon protein [Anaerocolumna cellulosilytica]BCJ93381.1 hypothetical protein acsn021_09500 [Anaerocolumna cellulosilytica]